MSTKCRVQPFLFPFQVKLPLKSKTWLVLEVWYRIESKLSGLLCDPTGEWRSLLWHLGSIQHPKSLPSPGACVKAFVWHTRGIAKHFISYSVFSRGFLGHRNQTFCAPNKVQCRCPRFHSVIVHEFPQPDKIWILWDKELSIITGTSQQRTQLQLHSNTCFFLTWSSAMGLNSITKRWR